MVRSLLSPLLVVITVLIIPSIGEALVFLPLIFSLAVSLVNLSKLKSKNKVWGVLLFLIQTYVVFLGLAITTYLSEDLIENLSPSSEEEFALRGIILVTLGGYLAALLLYFFSTFLFVLERKRFGYYILTICYAIVVLVMQVFSKAEYLQFGVEKFAAYLVSWVIFMSLGFSIILNKDEITTFFKSLKRN
ncbi:MAG TPA: hypothetical protein VK021_03165 [Flavobacteriaceae bacterium]|nr:hypothetical protein [Flavobacteriaceae bacterium]